MSHLNTEVTSAGSANKTLKERVDWALNKPDNVVKKDGIKIKQQRLILINAEKNGVII